MEFLAPFPPTYTCSEEIRGNGHLLFIPYEVPNKEQGAKLYGEEIQECSESSHDKTGNIENEKTVAKFWPFLHSETESFPCYFYRHEGGSSKICIYYHPA